MSKKISQFLFGLTLPGLTVAASDDQPGQYYIAPGVAYYHFSDARDLRNAAMTDVAAGYAVTPVFSVEAMYGQVATQSTPSADEASVRFHAYWLEGIYHLPSPCHACAHPYVLGGIGITNQDNIETNTSGNTTWTGVNAGAGVEYFIDPRIGFFTDVRDIYTLSGGKNDWMLNVGVKFLLGEVAHAQQAMEGDTALAVKKETEGFYELQESSA